MPLLFPLALLRTKGGRVVLSNMLVPTWDSHTTDIKKDPKGSTYICVSYGHLLLLSYISDQKNRKRVKRKKNIKIIQQELKRASTDRLYSSVQFCNTSEKCTTVEKDDIVPTVEASTTSNVA